VNNLQSLPLFWPEFIVIGTILVAIVVDLILNRSRTHRVSYWVLGGLVLTYIALRFMAPLDKTTLFMDNLAFDPFSQFFKVVILLATVFVIIASLDSSELKGHRLGEYFILLTVMVLGLFLMVSAIDLIMVYLSLEVVSISSFILAGYLKTEHKSNEAALKYVIYGAFSSGIMLFGLSILFGITGSTKFFAIKDALQGAGPDAILAVLLASIFILAGLGYKISAVPFHFWTPDVYEGAPTPITAYLSVAPKAAGFALIIRFFNIVLTTPNAFLEGEWLASLNLPWPQLLAVLSVLTMTLGNLVAIQQKSVKRMLAYSSIAHAGYMLMALPTLSQQGVYAIMLYVVMYLFMNLGAFFIVIYVKGQVGGETFKDFQGLGWRMPVVGVTMSIFMFSLTGVPPTAGFIGKFYLFAAVIKSGPHLYWLAIVGALNSVVSLYYYLRVVKAMYLQGEPSSTLVVPRPLMLVLLVALAVPTVLLGIYWAPVANWVSNSLNLFTQAM